MQIGYTRLLYVNLVPASRKTYYMSVFYAWIGLTGGLGPLLAGWGLDWCRHLAAPGGAERAAFDSYVPVFLAGLVLMLLAMALTAAIRPRLRRAG